MASIVDSIRSVYSDNYSLLRLGLFSYMIYLLYNLISKAADFNITNSIMWLLIIYMYLGFCCIIMNNRIKQKIETLPPFDPIYFLSVATKALIIFVPFSIAGYFLVNFVVGLFDFEGVPQQVAIWIIRFIVSSVVITALLNYSQDYNLKDGLSFPKLLSGIADVLVFTGLCVILIALYSLFIVAPTLYLIYSFFDIGPLFNYVAVFFVTLNLAFAADFWGQLHFDIESRNNYY